MTNQLNAFPAPRGKVNRRALAAQRTRKADLAQVSILVAIALVILLGALSPATLGWPALASVCGLAVLFRIRAAQWAKWEPYTRTETGETSWRPTRSHLVALLALSLATLAAPAHAAEEPRTLLVRAHDDDPKGHLVFIFATQERCLDYAAALTVKYRILGTEKTVYYWCRAPILGNRAAPSVPPNS
jgi:hypothetical protein